MAIVVYGTNAHTMLESTRATRSGKDTIRTAIARLSTEGSTNAQAGLELGYEIAGRNLREGGINGANALQCWRHGPVIG